MASLPPLEPWQAALVGLAVAAAAVLAAYLATRPARFDLDGAVVLITGGSSGIGKAAAAEALARGAHVALLARREAVLKGAYGAALFAAWSAPAHATSVGS
jgi:3-dehydrosphinganine reductase